MSRTIPRNIVELVKTLKEKDVPESEYKLHVDRYLEAKARLHRIPIHGTFELTPLCNLDCKMCYVHLSKMQFSSQQLLPLEIWKDIIKQAHEIGMLRATLTGGECLTYPEFDELYSFLWESGIRTGIMTNGVLLCNERISLLRKYPPNSIQVTLYGRNEDEYEAVTGHRVFETVYHNLKELRNAGFRISVIITPNEFMHSDFQSLIKKVVELQIPYYINSRLFTPRTNTGRDRRDLTVEQYIDLFNARNKMEKRDCEPIGIDEIPDGSVSGNVKPYFGLKCSAGQSTFTILYDGNMCPCVGLNEITTNPLSIGFKAAWEALEYQVATFPMPIECQSCPIRKDCLLCPALHKDAPKGHCDKSICRRTKDLIRAGLIPLPKTN